MIFYFATTIPIFLTAGLTMLERVQADKLKVIHYQAYIRHSQIP